jgi:PAS domain S-box-containing protein
MGRLLRILSIEDDPNDTTLIQDLLETEGLVCEVTRVDTEAALLSSVEQGGIDLILADYSLPSFDGISALKCAMKACPDVPFIFVSGTLGEEVAIEALKIGATDYVLKTRLSRLVPSVLRALREATERAERRRAEESLRQSETYLAEAQRLSRTGSFGWNVSSGEIYWSEETYKIFDYDRAVKPTLELAFQRIHPDDRDLVQRTIDHASGARTNLDFEHRLLMPDGSVKYLHVLARASEPSSSNLEYVGAVMDVTAAERTEETLREREAYLAEAQRLSHTGSWARVSTTGEMRYWSEECYRVLGFEPRDGLPRFETFLQRVHPDDQAKVREVAEIASNEKVEYELDYRIVHPGGDIRDIHTVGHPVLSPSGDLVEFVGTVMDVTERKRAEEALRRSEAYLAEAQRLTHTGSWACDLVTREMRHSSEEHSRLYGFDPEKEIPSFEEFVQRIHPEDRPRVIELAERANNARKDFEAHFRVMLPDGTTKYVYGTGHPVFNPSGGVGEFVGIVMDVTERRRADEERERLGQAQAELAHINRVTTMGELTASLAHEIKQPIAAAVTDANTCLRWLAGDRPDLDSARAAASRVVKDAVRASDIISRISLLFKKGAPQRELVDANDVIREMVVLLRGEATGYSIFVRTELADDLPHIMGDRMQLQQVLMNLIMNSIDAMKDVDGTRELTINSQRSENGQLLVSVSDTGVGLPPQQADEIFHAFFTTKPQGTGMGLRISRSIVESHGGRLWAADNPPRGTSFYFTLPATGTAQKAA